MNRVTGIGISIALVAFGLANILSGQSWLWVAGGWMMIGLGVVAFIGAMSTPKTPPTP